MFSEISCQNRAVPKFARQDPEEKDAWRPGDQVNYTCFDGYDLEGSSNAICQNDKTWSNMLPTCRSMSLSLLVVLGIFLLVICTKICSLSKIRNIIKNTEDALEKKVPSSVFMAL